LVGAPLFLGFTGWWRYVGRRFPSRTMVLAGFFMALVIATTTLNYTFAGVSILFMLLMMRAGVLILSPIVDTVRRRRVRVWSWAALAFSLLAVITALSDVSNYVLTAGAVVSLAFYFFGYVGRFQIMSRVAKTGLIEVDRRYFAEEAVTSAVWQVLLCGLLAVLPLGAVSGALRAGFTTFLATPAVVPAFAVGLLYSALYVYGTLIYLDPREYTWCVPANRCASLLSGLVASFVLTWLTGIALPGTGQFVATGFVVCAIFALSYPALFGRPVLLFVSPSNPTGAVYPREQVGVCVDTYHIWWDPSVWRAIERAGDRISIFQVCDWITPLPEGVLLGRGMMGDGCIELRRFREAVDATGYAGPIEVEIFNQGIWDSPGQDVVKRVVETYEAHVL
ncbi:TIM barrel protein, partial [Kibdelosporangium lantanae]